jgi:uncharacterized membrane protein YphA (DoxX/SURF4 family)
MFMMKKKAQIVARVLLGILFALSGILKIISPSAAAALFSQLLSTTSQLGYIVTLIASLVEILTGCLLLWGRNVVMASMVASLILLGSTFIGILLLENPVPCGCFGKLVETKTDEFFLLRNLVFLAVSIFVLKSAVRAES